MEKNSIIRQSVTHRSSQSITSFRWAKTFTIAEEYSTFHTAS